MRFDTIIRGGTIVTAADTFSCDVGIFDGKVTALGNDLGGLFCANERTRNNNVEIERQIRDRSRLAFHPEATFAR